MWMTPRRPSARRRRFAKSPEVQAMGLFVSREAAARALALSPTPSPFLSPISALGVFGDSPLLYPSADAVSAAPPMPRLPQSESPPPMQCLRPSKGTWIAGVLGDTPLARLAAETAAASAPLGVQSAAGSPNPPLVALDGDRELEPRKGLPPGWKCIEKKYIAGPRAGKVYRRFIGGANLEHYAQTLRDAVRRDALDRGLNVEEALANLDRLKQDKLGKGEKPKACAQVVACQPSEKVLSPPLKKPQDRPQGRQSPTVPLGHAALQFPDTVFTPSPKRSQSGPAGGQSVAVPVAVAPSHSLDSAVCAAYVAAIATVPAAVSSPSPKLGVVTPTVLAAAPAAVPAPVLAAHATAAPSAPAAVPTPITKRRGRPPGRQSTSMATPDAKRRAALPSEGDQQASPAKVARTSSEAVDAAGALRVGEQASAGTACGDAASTSNASSPSLRPSSPSLRASAAPLSAAEINSAFKALRKRGMEGGFTKKKEKHDASVTSECAWCGAGAADVEEGQLTSCARCEQAYCPGCSDQHVAECKPGKRGRR